MTPTLSEEKAALLRNWREDCRLSLLELEKKSIFVRVSVFEKIINEKTTQVNRMLCINTDMTPITPYKHYTDTDQQCKFIENWNGLNTNQMRSLPKSLQEYENRAKNWLNGRRAINYAQNLFPEMILCAEHYASTVSNTLFGPITTPKKQLYADILLYAYISGICCGRVALYDGHHRASLICENSIKKEGNLKRLLQKYFDGTQVQSYAFPKHLQDAIDYFKNKYHEKLNQFQTQYTHRITTTRTNDIPPTVHVSNGNTYVGQRGGIHMGFGQRMRNNPIRQQTVTVPRNIQISGINNDGLLLKMSNVQRRNSALEQELAQYREQQRVDRDRIKTLEDRLGLLQQSGSNNSPPSSVSSHSIINTSPMFKRDVSDPTQSIITQMAHNMNNIGQSNAFVCGNLCGNNQRQMITQCAPSPLPLSLMNEQSINSYNFCNRSMFGNLNMNSINSMGGLNTNGLFELDNTDYNAFSQNN